MPKTLEELRKMSYKEIAEDLGIPKYKAIYLKIGIDPVYFPVLTDHSKSVKKMAEDTELKKSQVCNCRSALITTGIEKRKEKIEFAHRFKPAVKAYKVRDYITGNPSTNEEIGRYLGMNPNAAAQHINVLKRKGEARNVVMRLGTARDKCPFSSEDLIGELSGKSIAYVEGDDKLVGKKITDYLSSEMGTLERRILTKKFNRFLPQPIREVVFDYMRKHSVK